MRAALSLSWSIGILALATGAGAQGTTGDNTLAAYHSRADVAIQSFLLRFWNQSQNYLNEVYPSDGRPASYWAYANGWRAVIDNVQRTQNQQYSGLIETFYNGQDARGWYDDYSDDENWMALALLHAYEVTSDVRYLRQARALYTDIENGWDAAGGGIWWNKAHTQKATASNAGPVIAGCRLYAATGDETYLSFARQVYAFWWSTMVDPSTYQVADHLNPDGTKVWWKFTYNEGLMIGASRELYTATGDARYLSNAEKIADFMTHNEVVSTLAGSVLFDGKNPAPLDPPNDVQQFKGPAYHYLSDLYQADPQTRYYDVLKDSADAIWILARESALNLFAMDWAGPPVTRASSMQENAAAIALSDFARTLGGYPGSGLPANRYEAENGTLHSLGLESTHGGFTGWGYVAGWNADGEWVDFHPTLSAGTHTLTFRYAAAAGDARRLVAINGKSAFPSLRFPGTGSWNAYGTVSVSYDFPAGASTVSVIYNSSLGSANYLNLDNLVVD